MLLYWLAGIFDTVCIFGTVRKLAPRRSRISLYPFAFASLEYSSPPALTPATHPSWPQQTTASAAFSPRTSCR